MNIGTAGLPIDLIQSRDYDAIFSALADAGIDVFCPTTVYEEIPVQKGLGLESDLLPPPFGSATPEIYQLARDYGIKIAFSADYLFPVNTTGVDPNNSPLDAIIAAGGRDIIHSIVNYDEPVFNGLDVADSQAVYEHVKAIDPTIQVVQVHAPVHTNNPTAYLNDVKDHAQWADVVGFDVYPIGGTESGARTPYTPDRLVEPGEALRDYMTWLETEFPGKETIMVLQAFEKNDLYSDAAVANMSAQERADSRAPTLLEMREMMIAVQDADMVFFWGASLQDNASNAVWQNQLAVSELAANDNLGTPIGALSDINAAADAFDEDAGGGTYVGVTLEAQDNDALDSVTYTLDDNRFDVDASGHVYVKGNQNFDFETEATITVNATAHSTDGSESAMSFTLNVRDALDVFKGTNGNDEILGGAGRDSITSELGNDVISSLAGDDFIRASGGNDLVFSGAGHDTIYGGGGNDSIVGEGGNDLIEGRSGNDAIMASGGNDTVDGGTGDDIILAVSGNNVLRGGDGFDQMQAGTGSDRFEFSSGDDTDHIYAFDVTQDTLAFDGPTSMADLNIYSVGVATVIEYDGGMVGLIGVNQSDLTSANFDFI